MPPEIVRSLPPRPAFRLAVFDFDGTLSLVRSGWQGIMAEVLTAGRAELRAAALDVIERTTGHPPLRQMTEWAEWLRARGGEPKAPETYLERYQERLLNHIAARRRGLRDGQVAADRLLVPGARPLLAALQARGLQLALLSGTDLADVQTETDLLGLRPFFGREVFAPGPDDPAFTKGRALDGLLRRHRLDGAALLAFGDGAVEVAETAARGGVAVGVALDEERGEGLDAKKRAGLIASGASLIIEDYRDLDRLAVLLFPD